jgi:hypothetical protein
VQNFERCFKLLMHTHTHTQMHSLPVSLPLLPCATGESPHIPLSTYIYTFLTTLLHRHPQAPSLVADRACTGQHHPPLSVLTHKKKSVAMETAPVAAVAGVGTSSSPTTQGVTGRLSAATAAPTPASSAHSASTSVSSTPRPPTSAPSNAAAAAAEAASAPDGTAMLSAPLGLQASVLSQPSFYPSLGEDMGDVVEEGDILFPVLGDPWSRVRCCTAESRIPQNADVALTTSAAIIDNVKGDTDEGDDTYNTASPSNDAAAAVSPTALSAVPSSTNAARSTRSTTPQPTVAARAYPLPTSLSSSTALCVQPVLTLPRKVGVSLASEVFRALLCFRNAATYPLSQAVFHIGVAQPPAPLRRALLRRTVPTLPPKSNYTIVAAVPLSEASNYLLAVAVDYNDPSGRQRNLSWSSTLKTEQPVMEVQPRRLASLRPSLLASPSSSRMYARYQLTLGLRNMSSVPVVMTAVELILPSLSYHNGKPLLCDLTPAAPTQDRGDGSGSKLHRTQVDRNVQATASSLPASLLLPGDTLTLVYVVGVYLEELRHATVVHGQGGVTTKLLSPRLTSFGQVQWTWCRANGETGTARSAPLRVEQLVAEPDVTLRVTAVVPATTAAARTEAAAVNGSGSSGGGGAFAALTETAVDPAPLPTFNEDSQLPSPSHGASALSLLPSSPSLLLAGSPVTIRLALHNHSTAHRYDVALKVRVERLAPQWLYTGPTVRLLGLLEPASVLNFALTLLPWQAGVLQVVQSALEVVDAQMPEAVLWPPSSTSLLQPVEGQTFGLSSAAAVNAGAEGVNNSSSGRPMFVATVPAVAQTAMKAALPPDGGVLCEVLVL